MFKVETRTVAEQQVLAIEKHVLVPALPSFIEDSMNALYARLGEQASGTPFVIYHGEVGTDSDGPVEVCVPYTGTIEPSAALNARIEPAHEEAFTRISKAQVAFPGILEAYEAVDKWIFDNGLESSGSPREVYFADWDRVGEDDPACDIAFPIKV